MWINSEEVLARFNGTFLKAPTARLTTDAQPTTNPRRGRPKKDS